MWTTMDWQKRLFVLAATMAVVFGVLTMSRIASQPSMSLLYSGLTPEAAGEVIAALDAQSANYDVRGNAIFVESMDRDRLRLTLAGEGLPKTGGLGYELLDNLSGFGTTSQMFDAAYLRAKEGELARTILANPQIKSARVHIAKADRMNFREAQRAKASVSVRGSSGSVNAETANAIRFLVSSAVAGLAPADVSVIDATQGVVLNDDTQKTPASSGLDRAALLKGNVERLIQARTGVGNSVVEVNVELLSDEETIVERQIDPDSRVVISTETQETTNSSSNQNSGAVSVASNLPTGEGGSDGQSSSQGADTREVINYEVSETTREIRRSAGGIKKISVAVLVGAAVTTDAGGTETQTERSPEELATLEDLVKSAIGFDEARGDSVTIKSMSLTTPEETAFEAQSGFAMPAWLDVMSLIQMAITAAVVLVLSLMVVRPILLSAAENAAAPNLLPGPEPDPASVQDTGSTEALTGEIDTSTESAIADLPAVNVGGFDGFNDDPVNRLRSLIEERQDETVEVLKDWLETPEEAT
ncbi:MAG: flagellar basal-body MS-ring/collar protein FliF [Pseudomonadota bacterium]